MKILSLCCYTAFTIITVNGNVTYSASQKKNAEWWSNSIMYQVYPRSFKDSNNDGIGDLKGITQKLDHFVDLGIDILWIGPIFKSPMDDMGYDVEDFKMIDPIFGTMNDFLELVSEMTKRGLKLVTDLIPNHTSYKCKWFEKSVKRDGKYTDYYLWRDAKNQEEALNGSATPIPPNNWLSVFGGTGWTWHTERRQFYYHQFNAKQPDLNIRNVNVQNEFYDIMEFWMDRGVVGFRFDALKHLFESDSFEDEIYFPGKENSTIYDDMIHIYTNDLQETIDLLYEWREFFDNYTSNKNLTVSRIISTESYSDVEILMKYYGNGTKVGAHIPFNFGLLRAERNNLLQTIDQNITKWLTSLPENMVANWVIENHDNYRLPSNFGPEMAQLLTTMKLVLPGVDVTYYGGEISMSNVYVRPDQRRDPNNAGGMMADKTRDGERSPMQWDDSINAGFTEASKPWLPVNPNYYKINTETQKKIPDSSYNYFKALSHLRKTDTIKYGDFCAFNISDSIYIVKRSLEKHESYIVIMNFGSETEIVRLSSIINNVKDNLYVYLASKNSNYHQGNVLSTISTNEKPLQLRPHSAILLTDKEVAAKSLNSLGDSSLQSRSKLFGLICALGLTLNSLRNYCI